MQLCFKLSDAFSVLMKSLTAMSTHKHIFLAPCISLYPESIWRCRVAFDFLDFARHVMQQHVPLSCSALLSWWPLQTHAKGQFYKVNPQGSSANSDFLAFKWAITRPRQH